MAKIAIEQSTLTSLADAVRDTTGKTGLLTPADMTAGVSGTITLALDSITMTKKPTLLTYNAGDTFETAGGEVVANYTKVNTGDKVSFPVTDWTVSPSVLMEDTTTVDVVYQEKDKRVTTPLSVKIVPLTPYDWDNGTGNTEWWTGLRTWLKETSRPQERKALIGKTVKIGLGNEHSWYGQYSMMFVVIAADHDGDKTLTFQVQGHPLVGEVFGPSNIWEDSKHRVLMQTMLEKMSTTIVDAITPVTVLTWNGTQYIETTDKIWAPSARQMGLSGEDEFVKGGIQAPYPYFTDDSTRIKKQFTQTGSIGLAPSLPYATRSMGSTSSKIVVVDTQGRKSEVDISNKPSFTPTFVI